WEGGRGNREVPTIGSRGGAEARVEEEGGSWGKPGFPRGSEPKVSDERAELLLGLADDELILGWRDSEWTGIAPLLEEDVAFSSIAQNEIGHARAVYELLGEDVDVLAFDRRREEYRCAPIVELHLLDWGRTIARRCLYEAADEIRITALLEDADARVAGLAAKINREEAYHRMHAELWRERLAETPQFRAAV